jgi:hypothetical protein
MEEQKYEAMTVAIPIQIWKDLERIFAHRQESENLRNGVALIMINGLADFIERSEMQWPYQTLHLQGGGWNIFFCEEDKEPRLSDVHPEPFDEDRKHNADRLRKAMNRKWHKAAKETEAMIEKDGAIIV